MACRRLKRLINLETNFIFSQCDFAGSDHRWIEVSLDIFLS